MLKDKTDKLQTFRLKDLFRGICNLKDFENTRTMAKYLSLEDLSTYKMALELSNFIWDNVVKWDYFAQETIGVQLVNAADSISASIAEGIGQHNRNDQLKFFKSSLGELSKLNDWHNKAIYRRLFSPVEGNWILDSMAKLKHEIHDLIHYNNEKIKV